jgi:hypothetical protein
MQTKPNCHTGNTTELRRIFFPVVIYSWHEADTQTDTKYGVLPTGATPKLS